MLSSEKLLTYFVALLFITPLLPVQLNETQFHITIITVLFLFTLNLLLRTNFSINRDKSYPIIVYFLILQVLLLLSGIFGIDPVSSFADFFSLFRPLILLFTFILISNLIYNVNSFILTLSSVMKKLCVIMFVWALLESIFKFPSFDLINNFLYKMERKQDIQNVAVTFFFLPYYASFISLFMIAFFYTCHYKLKNGNWRIYAFMSLTCVVLAQSKTGIAASLLFIFLCEIISRSIFKRIISAIIMIVFFVVLIFSWNDIIDIISYYFPGNFSRTVKQLTDDPESTYTLSARLEQFNYIYDATMSNLSLLGYGLGRDLLLESWPATIFVRYGWIGIFTFIGFHLYLIFKGAFYYIKNKNSETKAVVIIFSFWIMTTFITQLSALMVENSKTAFFYLLYLSVFWKAIQNKEQNSLHDEN